MVGKFNDNVPKSQIGSMSYKPQKPHSRARAILRFCFSGSRVVRGASSLIVKGCSVMGMGSEEAPHIFKDPADEGLVVKTLDVPGVGMRKCVMFRVGSSDEFDVQMETSLHALMSEEIESGKNTLRTNQAEAAYSSVGGALHQDLGKGGKEGALAGTKQYQGLGHAALPAPTAEPSKDTKAAKPEEDSDVEISSDEDDAAGGSDKGGVDILGTLLAGYMPPAATSKKATGSGNSKAAGSGNSKAAAKAEASSTGKGRSAKAQSVAAKPSLPARTGALTLPPVGDLDGASPKPKSVKGTGRGKGARLSSDPYELLSAEGHPTLVAEIKAYLARLEADPFLSVAVDPHTSKTFSTAMTDLTTEMEKTFAALGKIEFKISRRSAVPEDCLTSLKIETKCPYQPHSQPATQPASQPASHTATQPHRHPFPRHTHTGGGSCFLSKQMS